MKRALKVLAVGVLLVLAVPVALLVEAFTGNPPIPDGKKIAEGVEVIKDGHVSVFLLDAGEGQVALVDAGNDPEGKAILKALERRKLGPDAVRAIFLTHGHRDHTAGAHLFRGAEVMALGPDVRLAQGEVKGRAPLTRWFPPNDQPAQVTRVVKDGETVRVGNLEVQVYSVPGHTPGSAVYLARNVLFFGDSADARKDGRLVAAKWIFTDDARKNRAMLKIFAQRMELHAPEIHALAFAHTGVLDGSKPLFDFAAQAK